MLRHRRGRHENLTDLEGKVLFLTNANMGTRAAVFRHISKQQAGNVYEYLTQMFYVRLEKGPASPVFG